MSHFTYTRITTRRIIIFSYLRGHEVTVVRFAFSGHAHLQAICHYCLLPIPPPVLPDLAASQPSYERKENMSQAEKIDQTGLRGM